MRSRHLPPLTAALALVLAAALGSATTVSADAVAGSKSASGDRDKPRIESRTKHSSDGIVGKIAPPIAAADKKVATNVPLASWPIAPGVNVTEFDRTDSRGTIRGYVTYVDLDEPGVGVDYLGARTVRSRETPLSMVERDGAVLGVNGDFFDIADTGAPLGIGVSREDGVVHGRVRGWNTGFWIAKDGTPNIGEIPMTASVKQFPKVPVYGVNSPTVPEGYVGAYTPVWGTTSGSRVTDGATKKVREVVVVSGRVVSNRTRLSTDKPIRGTVLIGRGTGAKKLAALKVGRRVKVKYKVAGHPQVALTSNKQLLSKGARLVVDDKEMHPRTAIGIDRDTNSLIFLVIDGRQSFSRGYTMVELANLMLEFGAEDALNLDGGGSSAMVGLAPDGAYSVFNSPSDGQQRAVPDGLAVTYTPPS